MIERLLALSESDLRSLAAALRSGRIAAPYTPVAFQRFISAKQANAIAEEFQLLAENDFLPKQIALAIDLIAKDRSRRPLTDEAVSLVTTGPESYAVLNRDTAVVVRDLFAGAEQRVLVVGYAVYQGRRVFQALADRMRDIPCLAVRLCLDVRRDPADTTHPTDVVRRFALRFWESEWPEDRPRPEAFYFPSSLHEESQRRASLHAKCVVVDGQRVFISSANFTDAAQNRNIEVGLLIESTSLASKLTCHFDVLIAEGQLSPLR